MTGSRTRIVALGYQGFGNLGDEAILCGIEALLSGQEGIELVAVIGGPEPIHAFPSARRIVSRRLVPGIRAIRALARADVLLMAGGGLLHDHWPSVVPRYFVWTLLARSLRCRVVWLGVGIGPLRSAIARRLTGLVLRLSTSVFVRDEDSAQLAREVGGRVTAVIPDPAFSLPGIPVSESDGLAVVARPPVGGLPEPTAALMTALAALISDQHSAGRRSAILTFAGSVDRAFAFSIANAVVGHGVPAPAVEELPPEPERGLERLSKAEVVVSVRLHGMILAAVAGRPFVAVAYDPKVASVARDLGATELVVDPDSISLTTLNAAVARALDPRGQRRIAARIAALGTRREAIAVQVARSLRGEP